MSASNMRFHGNVTTTLFVSAMGGKLFSMKRFIMRVERTETASIFEPRLP